ncbi:CehA/McbA family metallohydrolase [Paenibacillus sp. CC-CFT747]|nr:CehA/McbA family metallohydrolase [Paenibacillus sp. CC-CFT747]
MTIAAKTGDPGYTYAPASRDVVSGTPYYSMENDKISLTIGTTRLETGSTSDYSDNASGNNKPGSLTPGHIMDAVPKTTMRDNLDYTEFVLSKGLGRTWWYPTEKLSLPDIEPGDRFLTAKGAWDKDGSIKAQVTYSIVENSPLIKMKVKLKNEGTAGFTGNLAYVIDPEETLEQQSYVPGWGWRGGQVSEYITSGWNRNYIFNGIQDKFTGNTAHALIWPDAQKPSALIPEGYITGAWFPVALAPGGTKELILYHLPHQPGPANEAYRTAEFWADVIRNGTDVTSIRTVSGTVTDSSGQPAGGIDVDLTSSSGDSVAKATTDSRGRYSLNSVTGSVYGLTASNGTDRYEQLLPPEPPDRETVVNFTLDPPPLKAVTSGVTKGDPGYVYEGTSRDWWPANDYYYLESPDIKFTVGTVRTAGKDPVDWSNDASGNNKWGTLTPGHMMDAAPKLTMEENLDFSEFVLSDNLGVTPEDEAAGMHMEWSWFHPLDKLKFPSIQLEGDTIAAAGDWDRNEKMKSSVRYSIVEGTPLIRMDITLNNGTGADFNGSFGYVLDSDQPGEQHTYLPGRNWVYSQEKNPIREGWTENYLFTGVNNAFTGKTAHAIIWPEEQQPKSLIHEGIFAGAWFEASIPSGQSRSYVLYHLPHVAGPADKPYANAELWAHFIKTHAEAKDYGSLTGSVKDETGKTLPQTEVVAKDGSGAVRARAVTTPAGKFQLYLPKGDYTIAPVNDAYSVEARSVTVAGGDRITADFVMKKYAELEAALPSVLTADTPFDLTVTLRNVTGSPIRDVAVEVTPPPLIQLLGESSFVLPVLGANTQKVLTVKAVALEGGRSAIKATASSSLFRLAASVNFDVQGQGYYAGDNHSHTKHSDGVNTVAENSDSAYTRRMLSWVWSEEHNKTSQQADADAVTAGYGGRFLSLSGTEITTPVGHALVYGLDNVPRYDIGTPYTWQNSINEVTGQGGLLYIAHPFESTYAFQTPYEWTGFTGVEVWNGTWHALDNNVNERAFRFWDEINIRGDGKYYGLTNTDGHTKDKVGDTYSKGWMKSLTEGNVLELLRSGGYYGSNGPDLRFRVGGVEMGGTLKLEEAGKVPVQVEAYDPNSSLTGVRVIKYYITGNMADYSRREVVLDEDLAGQGISRYSKTLNLPVSGKEFYRMEVMSEKSNPNSSGIGPLTGTGFAFSNPVWVEVPGTGKSNAAAVESLSYNQAPLADTAGRFGIGTIVIHPKTFEPDKLNAVVSQGAAVTGKRYTVLTGSTAAEGILDLTVTAPDGSERTFRYLVYTGGRVPSTGQLTSLLVSEASLVPAFQPEKTSYAGTVRHDVTRLEIISVAADSRASLTVNGTATASGKPFEVSLAPGLNTILVVVNEDDGRAGSTYTLRIVRLPV